MKSQTVQVKYTYFSYLKKISGWETILLLLNTDACLHSLHGTKSFKVKY